MKEIRPGDVGEPVRDVQHRLIALGHHIDPAELDGSFGPTTRSAVREFQQQRGLPADGLVGTATWGELVEAGWRLGDRTLYLRSPSFRGDDVRDLQRRLNALGFDTGKEDGIFGERTGAAVVEFQRNRADVADGVVGLDTVRSLERLRPTLEGPSRAVVREDEAVRQMQGSLEGSTIAIDPGGGLSDPGGAGVDGWTEHAITTRLAAALATELERRGSRSLIVRERNEDPPDSLRAERANRAGAAACVSIRLGGAERSPGAACIFYGTPTTHSPAGRRLAELVLAALVELGLRDAGAHPMALPILRETQMPAVQVEPFGWDDPDRRRLVDPGFPQAFAGAVVSGLEGLFPVREVHEPSRARRATT
jgi:N-acetylmuramoyl-L-alanine amidase